MSFSYGRIRPFPLTRVLLECWERDSDWWFLYVLSDAYEEAGLPSIFD